jgi:hypothetical protein
MKYFLVVYNRREGAGSIVARFSASRRQDAMRARFRAEAEHAGDPDTEIVVLGTKTEKDVRRTHARYFDSASDLVDHASAQAAS